MHAQVRAWGGPYWPSVSYGKFVGSGTDLPTKTELVAARQAKLYTATGRSTLRITQGRLDRG
jgi:hypothetical protein